MKQPLFYMAVATVLTLIGVKTLFSEKLSVRSKALILTPLFLFGLGLAYFFNAPKTIVEPTDYEEFMASEHHEAKQAQLTSQISFWEKKLTEHPGNFVYEKRLASALSADFKRSGNIMNLLRSDSLLARVNQRIPGQVGVLHALASNAVSRHAFREAEAHLTAAFDLGEEQFATSLMLAEVQMERGNLYGAEYNLQEIAAPGHFDFLVREMKMHDEKGDLESAIASMEKAADLARASGRDDLVNWSLSNLGDMYGHDGRIEKSYRSYLEALTFDPADLHSLRGIAWIAFSHDGNLAEAKRILRHLKSIHPVPDYDLLLADIFEVEGNLPQAEKHRVAFAEKASDPAYGKMYKTYLCEMKSDTPEAIAIAETEVKERPHPMSYDLLAWANFKNGNQQTALKYLEEHVLGKTSEPTALYHAGVILKAAGEKRKAHQYLHEALDAEFELGPVVTEEVQSLVQSL